MLPLARSATEEMLRWAVTRNSGDGRDALIKHAIATQKSERLRAMINLAKGEQRVRTEPKALDTDRWLVGCPNGTLDLRTGTLREARREDLITKLIGTPHDREAKCPSWEATVLWMARGDQAVADFLQAFAGYALTGEVREELLLALYGTGSNAKSTLVMMLLALMGEYGWKATSDLLVHAQGKEGAPTPDVAELAGKRLVVVSETENECELSEAQVKSITSNEVIPARRLRCQPFVFSPTHKTILSTNHRPRVRGIDHGIWRRLATMSCEAKRNERDEITDYRERFLVPELPGILNWALAGLARYREEGKLRLPKAMIEARAKHRSDEDLIGQWLAAQTIAYPGDEKATELQADLHHDYIEWLGKANRPLGKIRFGLALEERGFVRTYLLDKRAGIEGLRLRWRVEAEAEATKRAAAKAAAEAAPEHQRGMTSPMDSKQGSGSRNLVHLCASHDVLEPAHSRIDFGSHAAASRCVVRS